MNRSLLLVPCVASVLFAAPALPDSPNRTPRRTIERALDFLQKDAIQWRKDRDCATCHHGTMTVWALSEAKSLGYNVAAESLADMTKWTKARLEKIDQPRDTRDGWKMVNTPAIYLSLLSALVPKQTAINSDEVKRIARHLLRHQEADGSWAWSSAPPVNRPPPFFESDEVATLLASEALRSQLAADPKEKSEVREARDKAAVWLAKQSPSDTTQAMALRLFVKARAGELAKNLQPDIEQLLARQNKDGGWPQVKGAHSDAYATGQTLYMLNLAGVKSDSAEIRRAVAYLIETQKEDGSWPMRRRGHPGVTPSNFVIPITYFGSAWATLGLLRVVGK